MKLPKLNKKIWGILILILAVALIFKFNIFNGQAITFTGSGTGEPPLPKPLSAQSILVNDCAIPCYLHTVTKANYYSQGDLIYPNIFGQGDFYYDGAYLIVENRGWEEKVISSQDSAIRAVGVGARIPFSIANKIDWSNVKIFARIGSDWQQTTQWVSWSTNTINWQGTSWDSTYHDAVVALSKQVGINEVYFEAVYFDKDLTNQLKDAKIYAYFPMKAGWTNEKYYEGDQYVFPRYWVRASLTNLNDTQAKALAEKVFEGGIIDKIVRTAVSGINQITTKKSNWVEETKHTIFIGGRVVVSTIKRTLNSLAPCTYFNLCIQGLTVKSSFDTLTFSEPNEIIKAQATYYYDAVLLLPPGVTIMKSQWVSGYTHPDFDKDIKLLAVMGYGIGGEKPVRPLPIQIYSQNINDIDGDSLVNEIDPDPYTPNVQTPTPTTTSPPTTSPPATTQPPTGTPPPSGKTQVPLWAVLVFISVFILLIIAVLKKVKK